MRCGKVRKNLMAYHDGELGMAAAESIAEHLKSCARCSSLLAVLEKADQATGSAGIPGPDSSYWDDFTDRVMKKVKDDALAQDSKPDKIPIRSWFLPQRFAPVLSIALVAVVAAGVLMKIRGPAAPERIVYEQDYVAGKETQAAPERRHRTDLQGKGLDGLSESGQVALEPAPVLRDEKPGAEKAATAVLPASPRTKKEAAADGVAPPADLEEEPVAHFTEKDDLGMAVQPPVSDLTSSRSFLAVPSQELSSAAEGYTEPREPLVMEADINDGSWGQLEFARRLEEKGKHVESERVLDDLLARNPSIPIQEQASILLVSVLTNQNRLPEARQVLENAQRQYPGNVTIQNYRVGEGE